jgi:hypothetical protein
MIYHTLRIVTVASLFYFTTSIAIQKYQPIVDNTNGFSHALLKRGDDGDSLSGFTLSAPPASADNGPAPTLTRLEGEHTHMIICQVNPNAPQLGDILGAGNILTKVGGICPAYPEKYNDKPCVNILEFGTVDIQLCYAPKTGVDCVLIGNTTKFIADVCGVGNRSGGWSIVKGPNLGEGIKVFALE